MERERKIKMVKTAIIFAILLIITEIIYKTVNNISYLTREKCILYKILPKSIFLIYEYFVELSLLILIGIFIAILLEKSFSKYKNYYPRNPLTAFIYASIIPICACSAIPLLKTLKEKINFRTLITFVVAAPLLNPYIIILSFSVIGIKYGIARILSALILAISSGYILEFFYKKGKITPAIHSKCTSCNMFENNIYLKTYNLFKSLIPYIIIAGAIGLTTEFINPQKIAPLINNANSLLGIIIIVIIGIPIYLCNGADILIMRPFIHTLGFGLGTSISFSLTSTAICLTSAIMLFKFIGKKLTLILLANIFIISIILGLILNLI